ncbi:MAG: amidohydrolase family protein [Deltaproteobacteria bacterium]
MPTAYPTRFENLLDLARLPWFGVRDGRLVVEDPTVPLAVDLHTHLALSYVLPNRVDLLRASPRTEHYLPTDRPLDFGVYANRNFMHDDLSRMERDLALGSLTAGGMRATHTVPNLLREMGELRIANAVLLPIDFPALSDNAGAWLRAAAGRAPLIGFGSVHPAVRNPGAALDRQIALGARGIKVHPAVQLVRPDSAWAMRLYAACGARGLPVFFHCGPVDIEPLLGRYLSQVRWYERAVAENPDTVFVLGHSGAMQLEEALRLVARYPNVWVETSSQSLQSVRRILAEAPADRIMHGSDWPFYHQAMSLAKVFLATDQDTRARHAELYGNAARLLGLPADPAAVTRP